MPELTSIGLRHALSVPLLAALVLLSGCATAPRPAASSAPVSSGQAIDMITGLLDRGDAAGARKLIKTSLKRDPGNPSLALLSDSVTRDPVELLGPKSYPYTVKPGETLATIAERRLGNRLLTYQLARYNGIDVPTQISAGQILRIPGSPPQAAPTPAPKAAPQASPKPARALPVRPSAPAAAAPANPAVVRQLRTRGLAELNRGQAARAVQLLRQASSLDPGNGAIKADLARAERIAATVRARK
ncbi:hypothetical protein ATE67_11730 [Sphingopyxis sp. H050]|nr:hypothetical protein ATE67_11730 [Sphingopyxis sp. H050]